MLFLVQVCCHSAQPIWEGGGGDNGEEADRAWVKHNAVLESWPIQPSRLGFEPKSAVQIGKFLTSDAQRKVNVLQKEKKNLTKTLDHGSKKIIREVNKKNGIWMEYTCSQTHTETITTGGKKVEDEQNVTWDKNEQTGSHKSSFRRAKAAHLAWK